MVMRMSAILTSGISKKNLTDLDDMTSMLRNISSAEDIDDWIAQWRNENAKNDGSEKNWNDCFPSVGDITISLDIVNGILQIWVEKNFFIDGKVIKLAQQVF